MELLVASSCASIVLATASGFLYFAGLSVSGITAEARLSDSAGHAIAYMQSRIRVATSITTDALGNTLTLGFDDNYTVDSNGDGIPWNDQDHYETFRFQGTNGTNSATASSNSLIYTPKVGAVGTALVPSGVRNLPGYNIFTMPYPGMVLIRFGVVDSNTRDHFQSIDIQATGVSLNRPVSGNVVGIVP